MTHDIKRGFTLSRVLDASADLVWQAWTDPAQLDWFFNPGTKPSHPTTVDLRVGGAWRQHMVESADRQYVTGGIYREIEPQRRLVFAWGASGGWPDTDEPDGPEVTVELTPMGEKTQMDLRFALPDSLSEAEVRAWLDKGVEAGMTMTIDRLVAQIQARAA